MRGDTDIQRKNKRMMGAVVLVVGCMVGLSFAAVPLYDLFCRVTGYGGTTQQATSGADEILDRVMTVRFDASIANELPWTFKPAQDSIDVRVGESALAFYTAESNSDAPTRGTASFNVTPLKVGQYFVKIECFCFTDQILKPGEETQMPVTFYIDPAIAEDPNLDDVETVTLSYTFFPQKMDEDALEAVYQVGQLPEGISEGSDPATK